MDQLEFKNKALNKKYIILVQDDVFVQTPCGYYGHICAVPDANTLEGMIARGSHLVARLPEPEPPVKPLPVKPEKSQKKLKASDAPPPPTQSEEQI